MDKQEFALWAAALKTYYPRVNILPNEQAVSLWYEELSDIPCHVLTAALKKWVVTETWPPTIAELRRVCNEIVTGERPDWGSGWEEVQNAIRRFGFMRQKEALASMSEITREAVRRIGWVSICESENPETVRAQFRQVYEICEKRITGARNLPPALRTAINNIQLGPVDQPALEGRIP